VLIIHHRWEITTDEEDIMGHSKKYLRHYQSSIASSRLR